MIESFDVCPYCGKKGRPCSEVISLSRAWARDACRKTHGGRTIYEPSTTDIKDQKSTV
jgi:hypothetical protein